MKKGCTVYITYEVPIEIRKGFNSKVPPKILKYETFTYQSWAHEENLSLVRSVLLV